MKNLALSSINQSKKKKILIVDDSPEAIIVLGSTLKNFYRRQVALSGEDALDLLESTDELPDLILLDVIMEGMNGFDFCEKLKTDSRFNEIPVIFISAVNETFDKVKAFEIGGVDYIIKPFQREEVMARIKTQLKLNCLQKEIGRHNKNLTQLLVDKTEEIGNSQMATVFALAKVAESRDDVTGKHLIRVKAGCQLIAGRLSTHSEYSKMINIEYLYNIEKASLLHDIGKVGIRDNVLLKSEKLSNEEFEDIKMHTEIGAKILDEVYGAYTGNNLMKVGREIARSHHEKWDGSGYPDGLIGEEIPLSARIVALVDAYDALRSQRPYKEAFTHAKSQEIILRGCGKHFDPFVVELFLECEKKFEAYYEKENLLLHV